MTKGNWEKDGYMTLEASFIMPITVILITALMYLSFLPVYHSFSESGCLYCGIQSQLV